ncbi:MAG: hypothetical protein GTO14_23905 [Anaerolineales bacterium]|nr:hypothetical protein [Anaerolineales bacterium]
MRRSLSSTSGSAWESILRVVVSSVLGSVFYLIWMALFLLAAPEGGFLEGFLWLIAPVVTGLGFAIGVRLFDTWTGTEKGSFQRLLLWPLAGCILGALIVYWFGPMLIVFSMLSFGTISISLREIYRRRRSSSA